jgi:hypothetical protein
MTVVTAIAQQAHTAALQLSNQDFTKIVDTVNFTVLSTATISINIYALNLQTDVTEIQLLVDDVILYDGEALPSLTVNKVVAAGNHSIDVQAICFNPNATATIRGITVLNLTTGI